VVLKAVRQVKSASLTGVASAGCLAALKTSEFDFEAHINSLGFRDRPLRLTANHKTLYPTLSQIPTLLTGEAPVVAAEQSRRKWREQATALLTRLKPMRATTLRFTRCFDGRAISLRRHEPRIRWHRPPQAGLFLVGAR
jgi:hypothetical protein